MRLAVGRERRSLWGALRDATDEPSRAAPRRSCARWREMADQVTPFRFFATVLGPDGGRRAFRARLGGEADDVLDTFLSQALAYEAIEAPSLQGFVRFIRANESDIKREAEEAATGVRVMTVHGAKGLEADVVFLADTGGADRRPAASATSSSTIGKDRDDPAFLWRRNAGRGARSCSATPMRSEDEETEREYLRLLYVAMTRARDVLYVAGVRLLRPPPRSWYTIVGGCARAGGRSHRDRRDGELAAPFQWPPVAAPAARRDADEKPPTQEAHRGEPPDWLTSGRADPALRAAAAAAVERARRARSAFRPRRRPRRQSPGDDGAAPRPRRASAAAVAARHCRRSNAPQRRSGCSPANRRRPRACRTRSARRRKRCSRIPSSRDFFGAESRAEVAIVGNVATRARRLRRERPDRPAAARRGRLAPGRLQDRPRACPPRSPRSTRPTSCSSRSTGGC